MEASQNTGVRRISSYREISATICSPLLRNNERGLIVQYIFSFTIKRDSMSLWDTGHHMRCTSAKVEIMMGRLTG
jgi:hypothetical protein